MSYTDSDTIKKIIQSSPKLFNNIKNEKIILNAYEKSDLQYTNIDAGTEVVKIIRTNTLSNDEVVLNDTTKSNLTSTYLVPNTVVVADSLTLTTIYVENKDYIIDYSEGKIERTSVGGSIGNGDTVQVWYIPFVQLTSGSDYNQDDDEGTIVRRAGTSIPDGATVYVDYSHSQGNVPDDLIDEVILETDAIFDNLMATSNINSSAKAIESAATNYCMYLISLSQAQKILKLAKSDSDDIGKIWINLSESYLKAAENFLSHYRYSPTYNAGQAVQNENSRFINKDGHRFSFRKAASAT